LLDFFFICIFNILLKQNVLIFYNESAYFIICLKHFCYLPFKLCCIPCRFLPIIRAWVSSAERIIISYRSIVHGTHAFVLQLLLSKYQRKRSRKREKDNTFTIVSLYIYLDATDSREPQRRHHTISQT